jgi:transposase-like protein
MPDIPTALPDKARVRALIRARGYSITDVARKIGRPPATLFAITGRSTPKPTGVTILRQLAEALSTPARPVRVSDISDWTGDDDIESEPETKVPAA